MESYTEFEYNLLSKKLTERVKELECLYSISRIARHHKNNLDKCLNEIMQEIPKGWQYPDRILAYLTYGDSHYGVEPNGGKSQRTSFQLTNGIKAELVVFYKTKDVSFIEQPFLYEEQFLLNQIGYEIQSLIEIEIKNRNELLIQQKLRKEDKLNLLGEITGGIAHELNTPLTNIIGYAQLLIDRETDLQKIRDLEKVLKSSNHASTIVKKLMYFSCEIPSSFKNIDVNELIVESVDLLKLQLQEKNISVSLRLEEGIPKLKMDPTQFSQVIFNIILNALDAMKEHGKLIVSSRHLNREVRLVITDNGIGMSEDELKLLFQPFYSKKRNTTGTGLGLPVSRGIIQAHQGRIEIDSKVDKGTSVTIVLKV